jgi:menaquinone-dependent protoporphyrinogen oxidase
MKVLVSAASKHGATGEIAERVAQILHDRGQDVEVRAPEDVRSADPYEAFVLGSAVYAGHWLKQAKEFVGRFGPVLAARPVWLFSSGPIGDPPKPEEDPVDVSDLREIVNPLDHRTFPGKLVKKQLSFGERAIVTALRAPEGDFRDWDGIESWASAIANALAAEPASS